MKSIALALGLLVLCGCPAGRVRYTLSFAPGSSEAALGKVVDVYKARLDKLAGDATFGVDAKAGTVTVELAQQDEHGDEFVREMLGTRGEFEFLEEAQKEFLVAHDTTFEGEHERLAAWRKAHADARLREFDSVARADGGPLAGTVWRRLRSTKEEKLLMRSEEPRFRFANADIESVGFSQDAYGYPAVSFELRKERQKDFGDWTAKILHHGMAIIRDDEILTLATVNSRLPGGGIIAGGVGGFTKEEVNALVKLLKLPPLPLQPLSVKSELPR